MATTLKPGHSVRDNPDKERFEISDGDEVVGFVEYHRRKDLIAFTHTEVDESRSGQGFAGELIGSALDAARDQHLSVLPFCPFVNRYVSKHPEYVELVPADRRDAFDL